MTEGIGDRVYAIRRALGPDARRPMAQDAFAELLTAQGGRRFYGPEISLIERGRKDLSLLDALVIMAVDPLRRTLDWLAGELPPATASPEPLEAVPPELKAAALAAQTAKPARAERETGKPAQKASGEGRRNPRSK
jgi:hypothetical protein